MSATKRARNAAPSAPRIARVHLQCDGHPEIRSGIYKSIHDADQMLARAFAKVPAPSRHPFLRIDSVIVWTDGYQWQERLVVDQKIVDESAAVGGVLRRALLTSARQMIAGWFAASDRQMAAEHRVLGQALLARLEAEPSPLARRNVSSTAWQGLTLLPDPAAAIGKLRARFIKRRKVVTAPLDADPDAAPDGPVASYPQTNHADVRYVTNYVSIALGNDLRTLPDTAQGVIWNHWHAVTQTVETLLRVGRQTDTYVDNEGLWLRQLPALVSLLDDARDGRLRNGRLNFRPVGASSEPYPDWVRDLRGRSGVYVIRERMHDGTAPIVYVGSSSADRLYETLTRHFQTWRRRKSFWSGQYSQGHDPGLTWNRAACEVAAIITPAQHALEMESRLIRRLAPRDNLIGQDEDNLVGQDEDVTEQAGETPGQLEDAPF